MNRELEGSTAFSRRRRAGCATGARLVVITFHSLEDRIVKHTLRALQQRGGHRRAGADEEADRADATRKCERNPRARSAKLRAAERVA